MKKWLVFILLLCAPSVMALEISYPPEHIVTTYEDGIFFSGGVKKWEKVFINNVQVIPEKNGAFCYSVRLNEGENIFTVQSKRFFSNKLTRYIITRIIPKVDKTHNIFIYHKPSNYLTTKDNAVLRSTPVDAGMNRIGYLPKNTKLYADGTYNEFSRVFLSKNNWAWVMRDNLEKNIENEKYEPQVIEDKDVIKTDKETTYVYNLSDNVPYSAVFQEDRLVLSIYNLNCPEEVYTQEFMYGKFPRYSVCEQDGVLYVTEKICPEKKDIKIVIDAGHGGREIGAVGCFGDKEKDLNLEVAKKLRKILEKNNFSVLMTREKDEEVTLNDRVKFAKDNDALIFISIHLNSVQESKDPNNYSGSIVFYFNPQSEKLAENLVKSVSDGLKTKDNGTSQASFAVIRPSEYIGALVELVYMHNPKDVNIYRSKKFAQTSAMSIYKGLVNYLNSEQ